MDWFTNLFINEAKNVLNSQGGSGSSLFAKSAGGDTVTFDGNLDGLMTIPLPGADGAVFVKITDAVPTLDDCVNGIIEAYSNGDQYEWTYDVIVNILYPQVNIIGTEMGYVIPYDNFDFLGMVTFPKAGIWLGYMPGQIFTTSLTIPGYTGFPVEPVIDTKYLPEHLHFGTEKKKTGMDTLSFVYKAEKEIDLNTFKANKISDSTFTSEECANGISVHFVMSTGTESTATFATATHPSFPNLPLVTNGRGCFILSIPEGSDAGEAGMYFIHNGQWYDASFDITIPGYTGFVVEQVVVIPMDEAYMPYLTSPGGKKFKLSVDDSGVVIATEV